MNKTITQETNDFNVVKQAPDIDLQISTAQARPRNVKAAIQEMHDCVFLSKSVAENCFYAYNMNDYSGSQAPKKAMIRAHEKEKDSKHKTIIIGPSIRLAEIALSCWGNAKVAQRVLEVGEKDRFVTAEGIFWDTQKNIEIRKQVKMSIVSSKCRYTEAQIAKTCNAAAAKAYRNAVFSGIPRVFIDEIFEKCKATLSDQFEENRKRCFDYFLKEGVDNERLLNFFGRTKIEDFSIDDLMATRGMINAIKDGEYTIKEAFEVAETSQVVDVKERISQLAKKAPALTQEAAENA